jgi:hypothetical protein
MKNSVTFAATNQLIELESQRFMIDDFNNQTDELDELLDRIEAQSTTPPPCQYTVEEAIQRVLQATADVDANNDLMSLEEFERIAASWSK